MQLFRHCRVFCGLWCVVAQIARHVERSRGLPASASPWPLDTHRPAFSKRLGSHPEHGYPMHWELRSFVNLSRNRGRYRTKPVLISTIANVALGLFFKKKKTGASLSRHVIFLCYEPATEDQTRRRKHNRTPNLHSFTVSLSSPVIDQ